MKLLIPQALAPLLEPRLAEIAPDLTVVRFDDQGEPDGDISDATIMLRWWTPMSVLRKTLAAAPDCAGSIRRALALSICSFPKSWNATLS
jgi:hypothetical protein